jgi:hypothetical protein
MLCRRAASWGSNSCGSSGARVPSCTAVSPAWPSVPAAKCSLAATADVGRDQLTASRVWKMLSLVNGG